MLNVWILRLSTFHKTGYRVGQTTALYAWSEKHFHLTWLWH